VTWREPFARFGALGTNEELVDTTSAPDYSKKNKSSARIVYFLIWIFSAASSFLFSLLHVSCVLP